MPVETEIQPHTSIRAPRGNSLTCKGWQQEAAMRMLMNNLDDEVAERPQGSQESATYTPHPAPRRLTAPPTPRGDKSEFFVIKVDSAIFFREIAFTTRAD